MKLIIDGYEVSITARHVWQEKGCNKSTLEFLNELSIVYEEASHYNKSAGYARTAEIYQHTSNDIYVFNNEHGLYK